MVKEHITICRYSTYFSIFRDSSDHRFDYFKGIDRQEDITDFIQIRVIDESEFKRPDFSVYNDILNFIHNNSITQRILLDTNNKVTLYDSKGGFSKIFKIISNCRYKYGVRYEIYHSKFSKIAPNTTNCNTREEKFVNYHLLHNPTSHKHSVRRRPPRITGECAKVLAEFISAHPEVLTKGTKYKLGEYSILFNFEPGDIVQARSYIRLLHRLGIKAELEPGKVIYRVIKSNIDLYHKGYPFIRRSIDNDRMTERMLIEYYNLKKVNRKLDYKKVEDLIRRSM